MIEQLKCQNQKWIYQITVRLYCMCANSEGSDKRPILRTISITLTFIALISATSFSIKHMFILRKHFKMCHFGLKRSFSSHHCLQSFKPRQTDKTVRAGRERERERERERDKATGWLDFMAPGSVEFL